MRLGRLTLLLSVLLATASSAWAGISTNCLQTPPANDRANAVLSGTFIGTGQSTCFSVWGDFNVAIYGAGGLNSAWNATVRIERSFDGGTTWLVAGVGGTGAQAIYSTPNQDVSVVAFEPEAGVIYRLNCTVYTSGTILYRLSTTGGGPGIWTPHQ